jgi:PelA/Pel-15E family pectate lyase
MKLSLLLILAASVHAQTAPSPKDILAKMRSAASFFAEKVATEGGYHFSYAADLSYGRSEQGEGPSQIELQRDGTPRVAMAFLEAYDRTKDRYYLDAARKAAMATVRGQLCTGGFDYIVEFDPEKRKQYGYRADTGCANGAVSGKPTTLDDNVTQSAMRVLMRVDRALDFKDAAIHDASLFALDGLMKAQYPNGAWPQRYSSFPDASKFPVRKASYPKTWSRKWPGADYQAYYTFNDGAICDAIDTLLEAARIYGDQRYRASAERGGEFILLAQMPDPQPAWAQQYDADMHPAWARVFEPPSISGGESQSVIRVLMTLYRETGNRKYLEPVPRALAYLEKSVLKRTGEPALARFYELETNRPLYITKGTQIQAKGLESARIDGYELSYSDESVITHYQLRISAKGLAAIRREYSQLAAADPATVRRDKLHGLSPWADDERQESPPRPEQVVRILEALDSRSAWVEDGIIGKADQVVSVFAARAMVLTINGRPISIREDDRIQLFQGPQPPLAKIIRSRTFAENLETLARFLQKQFE